MAKKAVKRAKRMNGRIEYIVALEARQNPLETTFLHWHFRLGIDDVMQHSPRQLLDHEKMRG
jgi:hypothetical protein